MRASAPPILSAAVFDIPAFPPFHRASVRAVREPLPNFLVSGYIVGIPESLRMA